MPEVITPVNLADCSTVTSGVLTEDKICIKKATLEYDITILHAKYG